MKNKHTHVQFLDPSFLDASFYLSLHRFTGAPPPRQRFEKGDEILYVRGNDPPLDGVVQKVHLEDETPYYTVLINVTGREKNTDHLHLRHKGAKVRMSEWTLAVGGGPVRRRRGMGSGSTVV